MAFAKLYTTKTPITSADILNDKVLHHQLPMLRILTDRGTEYCGKVEQHDYQLYLATNNIDHTKTKVNHHKQTVFASVSIKRFYKSFIRSLSARGFMIILMSFKKIWTNGSIIIIMSAPIKAKCAADEIQCRL